MVCNTMLVNGQDNYSVLCINFDCLVNIVDTEITEVRETAVQKDNERCKLQVVGKYLTPAHA